MVLIFIVIMLIKVYSIDILSDIGIENNTKIDNNGIEIYTFKKNNIEIDDIYINIVFIILLISRLILILILILILVLILILAKRLLLISRSIESMRSCSL